MTTATAPEQTDRASCPVCGTPGVPRFRLRGGYTVSDCPACGHRFSADALCEKHLEAVYDDGYFFGGGDGYDDYLSGSDLLQAQGRRYGALLAQHIAPRRLPDAGSVARRPGSLRKPTAGQAMTKNPIGKHSDPGEAS
jgi:hypothetical protein